MPLERSYTCNLTSNIFLRLNFINLLIRIQYKVGSIEVGGSRWILVVNERACILLHLQVGVLHLVKSLHSALEID